MRPGPPSPEPPPELADWLDAQPALAVLNGKWTLPIMDALHRGPRRYRDLAQAIGPRVSNKVLGATLRRLERHHLISREENDDDHTVTYTLTPLGRSLHPHVAALSHWSREHRGQLPPPSQS
jgi:DNA-binding HxlR family transcriptional regulator